MTETRVGDKQKIKKLKQQIKSQEKTIRRLTESTQQNLTCSICDSKNIILIYCTTCGTLPICNTHFRYIPRTRICPLCMQMTVSRRWSMTVPNSLK